MRELVYLKKTIMTGKTDSYNSKETPLLVSFRFVVNNTTVVVNLRQRKTALQKQEQKK